MTSLHSPHKTNSGEREPSLLNKEYKICPRSHATTRSCGQGNECTCDENSNTNRLTTTATITRSHSLSLVCKQSSINSFRYSCFVNSIFYWNSIPGVILSISSRASFRKQLYNYLCYN